MWVDCCEGRDGRGRMNKRGVNWIDSKGRISRLGNKRSLSEEGSLREAKKSFLLFSADVNIMIA